MTIIEQTTDLAGKIRMVIRLSNGEYLPLKFSVQPTTTALEDIEANYLVLHQYDSVQQEEISIYDHSELIKEFIQKIKDNPTVTLNQYNTWLGSKLWYEQAILRFFVYKLATKLSERAEVSLTDYTESQVLGKLRDWIVATPIRKIAKVVLNANEI